MTKISIKFAAIITAVILVSCSAAPFAYSQGEKIGYVDLRRTFFEYEKQKTLEGDINAFTEGQQQERTKMVEELTKMRDEGELLSGEARAQKQKEIDAKLIRLQEFDRTTREDLLNKKNEMFRVVIEDVQGIVEKMGKSEKYDYILDSRQIMYADEKYDLTDRVLKELNK